MEQYLGMKLDGRYELIEVIGTGGMAVVYKAKDSKLNRFVAVKILKPEIMADDELRHRFHTESEAVANLNHPNIVNIFDVSFSEDVEYLVMELVDGITLKQYMQQRGVLSEAETLHFITQILKALGHAHSRNIIHRDIKPQNVMILRDGTVKVTDFGIARIASHQQTITQNAFGSVHYIAPEQARGATTDGRTDIYSVGIMMYEMLTGRLPFTGENPVAIAIQHLNTTPPPLTSINPSISRGLEAITQKAMRTDPEERYHRASDMLTDIEAYNANPHAFTGVYQALTKDDEEQTKVMPKIPASEEAHPRAEKSQRSAGKASGKKYNDKLPILAGVFSAVVFMVVAIIAFMSLLRGCDNGQTTAESIEAPKLIGENYDEIVQKLKQDDKYQYLIIEKGKEEYNDLVPEGEITNQSTAAGMKIKNNSTITVDVSLGPRELSMTDITGIDYGESKNKLNNFINQNNLSNVTIKEVFESSDTVAKNVVIRTDPEVGKPIRSGDIVTLYISTGAEIKEVDMPNLTGYTLDEAKRKLTSLSLSFGGSTEEYNDSAAGLVIGQSVERDTKIKEGTAVNLVVSKGPEPSTSTSTTTDTSTSTDSSSTSTDTSTSSSTDSSSTSTDTSSSSVDTRAKRTIAYVVELPTSPDVFILTLNVNGKEVYKEELEASRGSRTYNLEGYVGTTYAISVYIDGVFYRGESVTF